MEKKFFECSGITIIPHEFSFKSNVNPFCEDIVYQAKRKGVSDSYTITWSIDENKVLSGVMHYKKMYGKLKNGEFIIVK